MPWIKLCYALWWDDLAEIAAPDFWTKQARTIIAYQGRLFWPAPFRDQRSVLARLPRRSLTSVPLKKRGD